VLVRTGLLVPEQDVEHEIVVVYPSGRDLLRHADGWRLKRVN
jgi:hypothetical protein